MIIDAASVETQTRAICTSSGLCKYAGDKCNTSRCSVSPDPVRAVITEAVAKERERCAAIASHAGLPEIAIAILEGTT